MLDVADVVDLLRTTGGGMGKFSRPGGVVFWGLLCEEDVDEAEDDDDLNFLTSEPLL